MLDTEKQIDGFLLKLKEAILTADVSPDGTRCVLIKKVLSQESGFANAGFSGVDLESNVAVEFKSNFFCVGSAKTEISITLIHRHSIE